MDRNFKRLSLPSFPSWPDMCRSLASWPAKTAASLRPLARHTFGRVVDLVVPASCPLCHRDTMSEKESGSNVADHSGLCPTCLAAFCVVMDDACPRCAAPLPAVPEFSCPYCRERQYRFEATVVLGPYRGLVRQAVLRMKYAIHEALALAVGRQLRQRVAEAGWFEHIDVIAPVPLHVWKRLWRGASAPALLAEQLGRDANVPILPNLLRCRRRTRKQGTLLPQERLVNVRGAFDVAPCYDITNARVLLVDDVMTTGATVSEATRALLQAGAASVRIAAVARGTGQNALAFGTPARSGDGSSEGIAAVSPSSPKIPQ